jgi:ribokinase
VIRIAVVGALMMDVAATAPRRPVPGETVTGQELHIRPGGKGFNQALAAARLGAQASLVGSVGGDEFGSAFHDALRSAGVQDLVRNSADTGTGVGLPIVTPDGGNSIVIVPRANDELTPTDVKQHANVIAHSHALLLQQEVPMAANLAAATVAQDRGIPVILNPAPADHPQWDLIRRADVLVPNEVEVAALAGVPEPVLAAQTLVDRLGRSVVVTLGDAGALIVDHLGPRLLPAPTVDAVDTVGAGDVFCAGLAVRLAQGASLEQAVAWAIEAASLSVLGPGLSQVPMYDAVDAAVAERLHANHPGGASSAPTGSPS